MPVQNAWTKEQIEYLEEKWGVISIPSIAKVLGKSVNAIKLKAYRMGFEKHINSGEYITLNQLTNALGRGNIHSYTNLSWIQNRGLPVKKKKSITKYYRVIYLYDFWKWANKNRMFIDFSKVEKGILGPEPAWVEDQRKADIAFAAYKKTPWTHEEDSLLKSMLKAYRHSYRDISIRLKRTEGGIKRRMLDLGVKERPLAADNHTPWTQEEVKILEEMMQKGYRAEVIAEYIDRSAIAIKGKIERDYQNEKRPIFEGNKSSRISQ